MSLQPLMDAAMPIPNTEMAINKALWMIECADKLRGLHAHNAALLAIRAAERNITAAQLAIVTENGRLIVNGILGGAREAHKSFWRACKTLMPLAFAAHDLEVPRVSMHIDAIPGFIEALVPELSEREARKAWNVARQPVEKRRKPLEKSDCQRDVDSEEENLSSRLHRCLDEMADTFAQEIEHEIAPLEADRRNRLKRDAEGVQRVLDYAIDAFPKLRLDAEKLEDDEDIGMRDAANNLRVALDAFDSALTEDVPMRIEESRDQTRRAIECYEDALTHRRDTESAKRQMRIGQVSTLFRASVDELRTLQSSSPRRSAHRASAAPSKRSRFAHVLSL
jgi:hypothetical protein